MPALPADIIAAKREAIIVIVSDPAIQARYPNAGDGQKAPATGYFENEADANASLTVRASLMGVERSRYGVRVDDLVEVDLSAGVPCWRLMDGELGVDRVCLTARYESDWENETTAMELWG
ncbi:MAG: hypothetical protein E2598_07460 [Sphingobium sp.]|nr:hypothetical protein [Sphingobium sp.]